MTTVLVPVDGSESGDRALQRAADVAKEMGAEVVVVYVLPTTFERGQVSQFDPTGADVETDFARGILDRALAVLAERGVSGRGEFAEGAPAQAILALVENVRPALIVMGSRGMQDVLPESSVSRRVSERAGVPVEVVA